MNWKEPGFYSEDYLKWAEQSKMPPLTNTQHRFAEWLLEKENRKIVGQIGDLEKIFKSVRNFIKNQPQQETL